MAGRRAAFSFAAHHARAGRSGGIPCVEMFQLVPSILLEGVLCARVVLHRDEKEEKKRAWAEVDQPGSDVEFIFYESSRTSSKPCSAR